MSRPGNTGALAALNAEIAVLEKHLRALRAGLGEFAHQARRAGDALERGGGRAGAEEAHLKRLDKNRKLTEHDIRACAQALDAARRQRGELLSGDAGSG